MQVRAFRFLVGVGLSGALFACSGSSEDPEPVPGGDGDGDVGDGDVGDGDVGDGDVGDGDVGDGDVGDGDVGDGDGDVMEPFVGFGRGITGGSTESGYAVMEVTIGEDQYFVNTNPWGGADQTITAGGGAVFAVDSFTAPPENAAWDVAAFPSVFRGASYGGLRTANSGMPVQISAIQSVLTGMKTNAMSVSYTGNTTYDIYFTNDEQYNFGGTQGPPDVYLMVWYHSVGINPINNGEGYSCAGQVPTNIDGCTNGGSVDINGKTFHRFIGPNGNATVISYAPSEVFQEWEFDVKPFIDDSVAQGILNPDMYLQSVQGGFEIINGGVGLAIQDFYIDVNP